MSSYLALFEHKLKAQTRLSRLEIQAVYSFLSTTVPEFKPFATREETCKAMIKQAEVGGKRQTKGMGIVCTTRFLVKSIGG